VRKDTDTAMIENFSKESLEKISSMQPFKGLGNPDDIASVAVFLASNDARWVTGILMAVDGGYTCH
jgi:NAD(P)-dependent dehydrogenase (short-subunit alcohol dehydrogenase family)